MDRAELKSLLIPPDMTVKQAIQRLNETARQILFVVDENNGLLGMVNDGDIRRGIIRGAQLTSTVSEVINKKFISINADCPDLKKRARELMRQHLIQRLPVINDKRVVVDVVFLTDYFLEEAERHRERTQLSNPVVLMAGGKGTRLDPFTRILPKPLIPLKDKPIIEHIMEHFYRSGFHRFVLILNYKKEKIKLYLSEANLPYEIECGEEKDYCGTAGGLFLLKDRFNDTFIVANCDTLLKGDYTDFFNWHRERKNLITIVGAHKEITVPYGVLNMLNGSLVDINEKPKLDMFVNTGTYVFEPEALNLIRENEYIDMDKLISRVNSAHKERVGVYPHWGGWFDLGQWEEYRQSLRFLQEDKNDL